MHSAIFMKGEEFAMLCVLVVLFCAVSALFASICFLSFMEKEGQRVVWSWAALARHAAICIILMLLCSTACSNFQRFSGFFLGSCFAFTVICSTQLILRNKKQAPGFEKEHLFIIAIFSIVSSILFFLVSKLTGRVEFVLLCILFAPFYSRGNINKS